MSDFVDGSLDGCPHTKYDYPPYTPGKYSKVPKFSDARKLCCNLSKIQTKRPNLGDFFKMMQMEWETVKTLIRLLL